MLALFALTLFVSAALLFFVQPMVAKMLLPLLGGAPAVWITCMVFFQAALLAGYGYAHASTTKLGVRRQALFHVALLFVPLAFLPIAFRAESAGGWVQTENPGFGLLALLTTAVGIPFFVVSASAPLLQKWFSTLDHPSGKDPYFLYAASNVGSMLSLAAYPLFVEPTAGLAEQTRLWRWGYVALLVLIACCAAVVWRTRPTQRARDEEDDGPALSIAHVVTPMDRFRWVAFAFVPSSFLLGVTNYVTTDIAAVPLFWVMPLAMYLGTFILVFAKKPPLSHQVMARILPLAATCTALLMFSELVDPGWMLIVVHLGVFFIASMVCHGSLAHERPSTRHLTEFYLWMAFGGVLGGLFNGIVAPAIFNRVAEYPLAIVLACLCRPNPDARDDRRRDLGVPLALGLLTAASVIIGQKLGLGPGKGVALMFGPALLINYTTLQRPLRFALGLGAIFLGSALYGGGLGRTIHVERNFFGVVRVTIDESGKFVQITHGHTIHGRQHIDPAHRDEPLGYYDRSGPLGDVFALYNEKPVTPRVGVVGLGAGTMASYAVAGQVWTFYEINPAVERIARDPRYFSYLADKFPDARFLRVDIGDARLRLHDAPDASFGLFILDAFSSDAIPAHLVTREALALYVAKLAPSGLLAFHISNRYLDLRPIFADLAGDAALVALERDDFSITPEQIANGKLESSWIVMARDQATLGALASSVRWTRLVGRVGRRVWTDDFSNLLGAFRW